MTTTEEATLHMTATGTRPQDVGHRVGDVARPGSDGAEPVGRSARTRRWQPQHAGLVVLLLGTGLLYLVNL